MEWILVTGAIYLFLWFLAALADGAVAPKPRSIRTRHLQGVIEEQHHLAKIEARRRAHIERKIELQGASDPMISDDTRIDLLFAQIFETLRTGESDLPDLVEINPDPSPLELELEIGPVAAIVLNDSLIGEIENLWTAKQIAERERRAQSQREAYRKLTKSYSATDARLNMLDRDNLKRELHRKFLPKRPDA